MVQPSFSHPRKGKTTTVVSPTSALDTFLDNQHQSYYEELYRSEAVCLCVLRSVLLHLHRHLSSPISLLLQDPYIPITQHLSHLELDYLVPHSCSRAVHCPADTPTQSSLLPPVIRHIILHNLWSYKPLGATDVKALCQIEYGAGIHV